MFDKQAVKLIAFSIARPLGLFSLARRLTRRGIMILGWHGVSLADEHERFPDLFITPDSFRWQLRFLQRRYKVIPLDEAVQQLSSGRVEPAQVVLTFDDGFYNFAARVAPILQDFGFPATVYLATEYVQCQLPVANLLLRDVILLSKCREAQFSVLPSSVGPVPICTHQDRAKLSRLLLDTMHGASPGPEVRFSFIKSVARDLEVDLDDLVRRRVWHLLNMSEVQALSQQGFSFQVHTHHHHNVVDFADNIEDEVHLCRKTIETATGQSPTHFCYPSGLWQRKAWIPLRNAGMQSAATFAEGPNFPKTPLLALRRLSCGESRGPLQFQYEISNLRYLLSVMSRSSDAFTPPERLSGSPISRKIPR